jgi:hypothetical protein
LTRADKSSASRSIPDRSQLTGDAEWTMPPLPLVFRGHDEVVRFLTTMPFAHSRRWRHVPVTANGRLAAAAYTRECGGGEFRAYAITAFGRGSDGGPRGTVGDA